MIIRSIAALLCVGGIGLAPCMAQAPEEHPLDQVERAISAHEYDTARQALERWQEEAEQAPAAERVRGRFLEGILQADPGRAERLFLEIAIDHPSSAQAPDALLRVGQLRYAAADHPGAQSVFERLLNDYPASEARAGAGYWAVLNRLAVGDRQGACRILLVLSSDARIAVEDRLDHLNLRCRTASSPTGVTPGQQEGARGGDERLVVVEAGPFSETAEAIAVRDRLRSAGIDALLVRRGADERTRVWLGAPAPAGAAASLVERARALGIEVEISAAHEEG